MKALSISLIQTGLYWENSKMNLDHFTKQISKLETYPDVIVLPEMFSTGFTMKPELLAEVHEGPALQWMQEMAEKTGSVITGSVAVKDDGSYYNRLYWAQPDGKYYMYNKRHLFRMGNEHEHYTAGTQRLIIEYKGWRICPLICYDLRFPVWSRNSNQNPYDVLIYVANWPQVRSYPWEQLLVARAIENQCYVAGVNRIGEDGNGIPHSGNSAIINPRGEYICKPELNGDLAVTAQLSMEYLIDFRKQFPVLSDADQFEIQ